MKWGRNAVGDAVERSLHRLQLLLPFAEEKTIDMQRCCSILHASPQVVTKLRATPLISGNDEKCLVGYNTKPYAPLRIDYSSVVRFLDHLRVLHGLPDRRPPLTFGRYRDEDLLPFRWDDTITVQEAADVLGIHSSKVLLRIEAGEFEAYQLGSMSRWRISRSSLARYIACFGALPASAKPYGASRISQGEV